MIVLIVLNYNDFDSTSQFIESIQSYDSISHIVVVDNCSSDGSYSKLLRYRSKRIHVIKTPKNKGYAFGNNYGMKYAISNWDVEYFIISNPDVNFREIIIMKIMEVMKKDHSIAICSAVMRDANNKVYTNFSSKLPKYIDLLGGCFQGIVQFKTKILHKSEYTRFEVIKDYPVFYTDVVPGSFFVADRKIFEKIGFFDEKTFLYYEENIVAYKLKNLGYREAILPQQSYNHYHSVSINKSFKSQYSRNKIMFDSSLEYLKILKTPIILISIYKLLYWIGFPERSLFTFISKHIIH